jgi:hypothetical protein
MKREKTLVLVPVGRAIEPECERGLSELTKRGYKVRAFPSTAALDVARSVAASQALADGMDDLVWIDSDIGFDADDLDRLCEHEASFTCALYPKRGAAELACHVLPGTAELLFGEHGGLTEVLYAGMGFCRIRREVFADIREKQSLPECRLGDKELFHPYFMPMMREPTSPGPMWYLAEDYAFCHRARLSGHPIFADTRIRLMHIGRYGYTWEDAMGDRTRYVNIRMKLGPPPKNE